MRERALLAVEAGFRGVDFVTAATGVAWSATGPTGLLAAALLAGNGWFLVRDLVKARPR